MLHFLLATVLVPFISVVCGEEFTSPVAPAVWTLGETQVVSWETDKREVTVYLWQEWPGGDGADKIAAVYSNTGAESRVSEIDWLVTVYDADLDYSDRFFFWINPDDEETIVSNLFNVVRADEAATSTTATVTGTATSSPSESRDPDSSTSTSLTSTDKIALGVGIGIGVPVLAALCALIWLKVRNPPAKDQVTPSYPYAGSQPYFPPTELEDPTAAPKEVSAGPPYNCHELPGQQEQSQQGEQSRQGEQD